jgi:hypothetical protein
MSVGSAPYVTKSSGAQQRGRPAYEVSVNLGRNLERVVIELPGGHLGCVTQPAEFARGLLLALERDGFTKE